MHARLEVNALRKPVPLKPIQWGKPDRSLADGVLHSVARMTPRISIPFNPVLSRKLRDFLQQNGVK